MTTPTGASARLPMGKRIREALRIAHLWIGVGLCIPFVVLGISGSYLVYHDFFDGLMGGGAEVTVSDGAARAPAEIVAAAGAAAPEGFSAVLLTMPGGEGEAATVRVAPEGASFRDPRAMQVLVDPGTLAILGEAAGGMGGVTRIMHDLHGHFMISGDGRALVGWAGVAMLALGISGLVIWWPKPGKLKEALLVRRRAHGYRLHRDLHGAFGFWTLIVFVVVSFTGVYIAFPQTIQTGVRFLLVADAPATAAEPVGEGPMLSLAEVVERAVAAAPDGTLAMAALSFGPGRPSQARFRVPGYGEGAPSLVVQIDPRSGAVLEISDPRQASADETFAAWQRPLHQGEGWGPVWRALVFVSGLLPLLFAITGITMWLLRRKAQAAARRLRARGRKAAA